jgi:uncharacterized protein YndB with AHSA1/START domain
MPILEKEITVDAPVERVFEFVDSPKNLPQIWPGLFEIRDVSVLPNGGHKFYWLYNMAGKQIKGTVETLEHVYNQRIVDKTTGDMESVITWTFSGSNGKTKVKFAAEYPTPLPFFAKKDEPFVLRLNE